MPPLIAFLKSRWLRLTFLLACLEANSARAWGPHPTITQAALDTLGADHALRQMLGEHFQRLTNYCWMADFKRLPFRDVDQDFYADDYLLFPGTPVHLDHICPEVKKTYRPYFARALQALRTESPANAARWIGSLLHFTEDTGSPPHAAEIRGPTHAKMENWVDAEKIHLPGYQPALLGTNDSSAIEGFLRRMDGLIDYSKGRGRQLMTPVLLGDKDAVKPVALECALETSRVVADLLHTLAFVAPTVPGSGVAFKGRVLMTNAAPRFERVPTKVVWLGTPYSTLTEPDGRFEFRNVPEGTGVLALFRPGGVETNVSITLARSQSSALEIPNEGSPGNLIRNGSFVVRWTKPDAPDCWYRTSQGWEGELVPLQIGRQYRLRVRFREGATGDVLVRWSKEVQYDLPQNVKLPRVDSRPLTPQNPELTFTGSETMQLLQVTIRSGSLPQDLCERIELTLAP